MKQISTLLTTLLLAGLISISNLSYGQDANDADSQYSTETDNRLKIRLGFTAVNVIHRQILLTVDDRASMNYDWGFDAPLNDVQSDDMSWIINDENYVIQGIDSINSNDTNLPLAIKKDIEGLVIISIDALENVPDDMDIYLQDMEMGTSHDLRAANYEVTLSSGQYNDRYRIVFEPQNQLSIDDAVQNDLKVIYSSQTGNLIIQNPNMVSLEYFEIFNISGQTVMRNHRLNNSSNVRFQLNTLSSGTYIVKLLTSNYQVITQKIVVR